MTYHFSDLEKTQIVDGYQNDVSLRELVQKFGCSSTPIGKLLIAELGIEKYKKIATEHSFENSKRCGIKNFPKFQKAGTEAAAKMPRSEKQHAWYLARQKIGTKASARLGQKRERNSNWKGGISIIPFEKKYGITHEEWKILAQKIRKRDKFICQYCGKKGTSVHHIIPCRIKTDNNLDNLITLCRSCHIRIERATEKILKENKNPMEIFYKKRSI